MKHVVLSLVLVLSASAVFATHGDQFVIDAGAFSAPSDEFCRDVAASDGLQTIVCAGERTIVFEKTLTGWQIYTAPLGPAVSVDINFAGDFIIVGNDVTSRLWQRVTAGTPDHSDDWWQEVTTFNGGASVAITRTFWWNSVIVGNPFTGMSTVYCGPSWSACGEVDGYDPVAIDAVGASIAATDPTTHTVYYKAGSVDVEQRELTGPSGSEFGSVLTFGAVGSPYLAIGAPETHNAQGIPAGACFFYTSTGPSTAGWRLDFFDRVDAPTGLTHSQFCQSVSMWTGPRDVLVGAPLADINCPVGDANCDSGAAFIFQDIDQAPLRIDPPNADSDRFGWDVFVQRVSPGQGEYHIITEPFSDRLGSNAGEALIRVWDPYLFEDGFESGTTCAWTHTCPPG